MQAMPIYDTNKESFVFCERKKMTLTQLQSLVRIATVNAQLENKAFPFALYEELYNFNRKEALKFLMQIDYEFFEEEDRDKTISSIGKYYYEA